MAELQERHDQPDREVDRAGLERKSQSLFSAAPSAGGKAATPASVVPVGRDVIERQQKDLFRASLRSGTAADSE